MARFDFRTFSNSAIRSAIRISVSVTNCLTFSGSVPSEIPILSSCEAALLYACRAASFCLQKVSFWVSGLDAYSNHTDL